MSVSTHERRSGSSLALVLGGLACLGLAAWTAVDFVMPNAGGTEISSGDPSVTSTTTGERQSRFVTKRIEEVQPGDLVVAKHDATGEVGYHEVVRLFRKKSDHLRILTFAHGDGTSQRIETTNEHPFWVSGSGWTDAEDLQPGDAVETADTLVAVLSATQLEQHPEGIAVYNFEVEHAHSYFVQQQNSRGPPLWVHNSNCGPDGFIPLEAVENAARTGGRAVSEAPRSLAAPGEVAFSQRTVGGNVTQYVDDMANNRWDWSRSGPINVMKQGDRYVTFDNRRLMAARQANLSEIPINVVDPKAIRPGTKMTWGEAFRRRFTDPRNKKAGGVVPDGGLMDLPAIAPKKN